jgi:hypothetical protein
VALVTASLVATGAPAFATTYYLSPSGNNSASGLTEAAPWKTFAKAFGAMKASDELVLLDGTYSVAAGTGGYNYDTSNYPNSGQAPSGASKTAMTVVRAKNEGNVLITVPLYIGRSSGRQQFIKLQGISWRSGDLTGLVRNASYIYIKNSGFYTTANADALGLGLGISDDSWPSTDHLLVEDTWIAGQSRGIAVNFGGRYNVWRRVIVRGDGCNSSGCTGSGNPNIGITVYASANTSMQNVMVVDRVLGGGTSYADFAQAQHGNFAGGLHGQNEWLGVMSLHSEDAGFTMDPDTTELTPGSTFRNVVAWDVGGWCMALYKSGQVDLQHVTCGVRSNPTAGLYLASGLASGGVLANALVQHSSGSGGIGVTSSVYTPSYVDLAGTWSPSYSDKSCSSGCKTSTPTSDGATASQKYITRIESGSALSGTGLNGEDYGANIVTRYGNDGAFYGDAGYNSLTSTALWPWPNDARIKKELCSDVSITRGFCANSSFTNYVWSYLGNPTPTQFGGGPGSTAPAAPSNIRIIR